MLQVFIPVRFQKRGGRRQIIAPDDGTGLVPTRTSRDETMIQCLARSFKWRKMLDSGQASNLTEIASREKVNVSYVCRLFDFSFLAPDIVEAILDGRQPKGLTMREMRDEIPVSWEEQRRKFGFPEPVSV
ncbi:MAG: hypothetical protein HQL56_07205 [Magnetococcales bacterium]|nr:hypothetical protein [Magnetococcales bacterium]